jgi:hypothetical protein
MNQGHPDFNSGLEIFNRLLENKDYNISRREFFKVTALVGASAFLASCAPGLSSSSVAETNSNIEQAPVFDNPEDAVFHDILVSSLPVTEILGCDNLNNIQGPGFAPSEAEAIQILSENGCTIPEDDGEIWRQNAEADQLLMYAGLATGFAEKLTLPVSLTPVPWDDLALAGLVLTAGTLAYISLNKANKKATSGHSTDKHAPYNPKGGPARYIIDQLSKGTSYCYTIKMLNRQGEIIYRTAVTTGVLNNPYLSLMAWFRNDSPNTWGGAFPYTGNPRDIEALGQTAKGILEVLSIACPQLPPAPNVP